MSDSHASRISSSKFGRRRFRWRGAVLSSWLLLACKIVNAPPPSDDELPASSDSAGNSGERERPAASGGSTSRPGTTSSHTGGAAAAGRAGIADGGEDSSASVPAGGVGEVAGASAKSLAGAAADGDPPEDEEASSCDLDGDCLATCHGQLAECEVVDPGYSCEFTQLAGVSQQLTCGEPLVAGNVCCGGCGCVDVVLYFDGQQCWQGLPACDLPEYAGKVLFPHPSK